MPSGFGPWCAETCIGADECQAGKSHQGVAGQKSALHRGIEWSKSTTALGLREWWGKTALGTAVDDNSGNNGGTTDQNPPCTVNVAVGSTTGLSGPQLSQVENNVNQYFQAQAGISVNFVPSGDPSATVTLNFINNAGRPPGMSYSAYGETFMAWDPVNGAITPAPWPVASYVNTQNLAQSLAFDPNGTLVQGTSFDVAHELTHGLTGNQVDDSDTGLMGDFDQDPGGSYEPPIPSLSPDEIQQLQEDNCNNQGDFGGNSGPMDPGSPDQPAVARPTRQHF